MCPPAGADGDRRRDRYGPDVLAAGPARPRPQVLTRVAEPGLVVEHRATSVCGAVVALDRGAVTVEDRFGRRRVLPLEDAGFLVDGQPVTLVRPPASGPATARTASGSVAVAHSRARVARAGRLYVEGLHDAALVERVWGDDLRVEGVVVEPLHGIDDLPQVVSGFRPAPARRLGVLVDHLVPGSKESRTVARVASPHVLVTGHPYVDVWQAVKPRSLGIVAWPVVPPGQPWKEGVCRALGVPDTAAMWRRVLAAVDGYGDLEVPLLRAVEELIDFVTAGADAS